MPVVNAEPGVRPYIAGLVKSAVSVVVVVNVVAAFILYVYLKDAGWTELLMASIGSEKGLALILMSFVFAVGSVFLLFCSSAFFLYMGSALFKEPRDLPRHILWHVVAVHAVWLLVLSLGFLGSVKKDEYNESSLSSVPIFVSDNLSVFVFVFAAFGPLYFIVQHWKSACNSPYSDYFRSASLGLFVAFASLTSTSIIWFATELLTITLPEHSSWLFGLAALALSVPGVLIGAAFLKGYRDNRNVKQYAHVAAAAFLTMFLVSPGHTAWPISMVALRAVGVYSTDLTTFQLMHPEQRAAYQNAGFDIRERESNTGAVLYFDGYVRYRFSEILLLCSTRYDPVSRKHEDRIVESKGGCIQSRTGEVRRLQLAQGSPAAEN